MITSAEKSIKTADGATVSVQVWNGTVANLSLMALGSSAPEILLSVIEVSTNDFYAGELGPSTIVGSAAFNLFVIIAVCISALDPGETRRIDETSVYGCTAFFSVFAYVLLYVFVVLISPNVIEVWPALMTHHNVPEERLREAGVAPNLIRVSVGIEAIEDLIQDLDAAFKGIETCEF